MQTLASHFSETGKAAMRDVTSFVRSQPGVDALVEKAAREIVLKGDAEAHNELCAACYGIERLVAGEQPQLPAHVVKGVVRALGELIVARVVEMRASEGRA
jgi:hypothetical protein